MYEEELEELNKWFKDDKRTSDTYFNGEIYAVNERDVEDFCDFLREQNPDMVGFPCIVGKDGIWFKKEDLDQTEYI